MRVERVGEGPPVVLVHGSIGGGQAAWLEQRPLAERWTLVIAVERRLGAERAVIPGAGHSARHTGVPFNERLESFLRSALQ